MIDSHCHIEQPDFDLDREKLILEWKKELDAVVTVCAHPDDFEKSLEIAKNHKNFVFLVAGIHPEYVKEFNENQIDHFFQKIEENKKDIVAIGETGLDFFWIKDHNIQQKQKDLFLQHIEFSKDIKKPLVIHSREAYEDTIKILEEGDVEKAQLHMWSEKNLVNRAVENGFLISINTILLKSKEHKKIARDTPIENLMLETDSPWLAPKKLLEGIKERNTPLSVKIVAEKISEIKKIPLE